MDSSTNKQTKTMKVENHIAPELDQHATSWSGLRAIWSAKTRAAIAHVLERKLEINARCNLFMEVRSWISYVSPSSTQEGFTRRFDLTSRVQTRSNNPQAASNSLATNAQMHTSSQAGCTVEYEYLIEALACAPAHTWALDQLAHQLPPECANSRL
ncbi:calcium channel [Dorcoceras hygrometricum]|uniref:Calcium channel n=1 Tax=Dorcoceras hygrometricum TaxID=472368 RepID=A0A2Z7CPF5_9LAMI|nr:calcium channel [Dorcoceras hygrometricum]